MGKGRLRRWISLAALAVLSAGCARLPGVERMAPADLSRRAGDLPPKLGHVLRVRVWADADYRREHVVWRRDVDRTFARANELLLARFGVSLEIAEAKPWERRGTSGDLSTHLRELEALDGAEDVDLVLGLVTALPAFERSVHALGVARFFGRHLVLRGMQEMDERDLVASWRSRDLLRPDSEDDIHRVLEERVRHREVVVLIHELGHALGMMHVADPRDLMNPYWDPTQDRLAEENARIFELSLVELLHARAHQTPSFDALIAHVEETKTTLWSDGERRDILAALQHFAKLGPRVLERRRAPETTTSSVAVQQLPAPPVTGGEDSALCVARLEQGDARAKEACARATVARPDDPWPALNLTAVALAAHDDAGTRAALFESKRRLQRRSTPDGWLHYARLAQAGSYLREAEDAAEQAGPAGAELLRWAAEERRRIGLARDEASSGVPRAKDPDLLARLAAIEEKMSRDVRSAKKELDLALAAYPRSTTLWTEECMRRLGSGALSGAEAACQRARELGPSYWRAHVASSIVAAARGKLAEAVRHAERAVAVEPSMRPPWSALATWYRRTGRTRELERLGADYEARFGEPLPASN